MEHGRGLVPGGFSSNQREVDGVPLNNGSNTFVATYVDPNSLCTSVQTFVITVGFLASASRPLPRLFPITQGSTTTDTVTVTGSGGFNGTVTLSATGLPAGVTASFGIRTHHHQHQRGHFHWASSARLRWGHTTSA